jgi:oligopeptide transport system substrate-binding protein
VRNIHFRVKKIGWLILIVCLAGTTLFSSIACQPVQTIYDHDVLNLYGAGPATLDPAISADTVSHSYVMQVFSGLLRLDEELEVVPDIAEKWQESQDGRTYTFYLRQGVKFYDGREVLAEDFKYSWERACNPETGSRTAATYLGDIVGVQNVLEGETTQISGVKVLSDYVLEVTIDAPKAYFPCKLTYPTTFVVDSDNVQSGQDWWRQPGGTGPFVLEEWISGDVLVLKRNEHYYAELAKVERVVFHLLAGMPMVMYERDEIDVTSVYQNYIDMVEDTASSFNSERELTPELSFYYVGFNNEKAPFDDVNIRRAFCHAVDKERIISLILRGMVTEAEGILPPGMPGYNAGLEGLDFDLQKAEELIAASKYGDPANFPPITITVPGYGNNISEYLGAIIEDWRKNLGVEVSVRQLESDNFMYHLKEERDEVFMLGWVADYPDPYNFLDDLFHSGSENNSFSYNNPEVDELLAAAAIEQDAALRLSMYQQIEQQIVDEAPCLPFSFGMNYILVKPYVKDYVINPMGIADLRRVYIERE